MNPTMIPNRNSKSTFHALVAAAACFGLAAMLASPAASQTITSISRSGSTGNFSLNGSAQSICTNISATKLTYSTGLTGYSGSIGVNGVTDDIGAMVSAYIASMSTDTVVINGANCKRCTIISRPVWFSDLSSYIPGIASTIKRYYVILEVQIVKVGATGEVGFKVFDAATYGSGAPRLMTHDSDGNYSRGTILPGGTVWVN